MTLSRWKRWLCGAVVGAVALGSSAAAPEGECLDPPPPLPPPEAFEACEVGTEGGACEVVLPGREAEGVCAGWSGGALFCRPFLPPPPPPKAFDACGGLELGAACGIPLECGVVRGTCDATPFGELFCRPAFVQTPPGRPRL